MIRDLKDLKDEIMIDVIPSLQDASADLESFYRTSSEIDLERAYRNVSNLRLVLGQSLKELRLSQ